MGEHLMMTRMSICTALVVYACCAILLAPGNTVLADTILLDDTFDVPTGAATRGDDAADSLDTAWYTIGPGATPSELSIVTDSVIGTGDAFEVAGDTVDSRIWGSFPSVRLTAVGDYVELSFDVNVVSSVDNTRGFRLGLYNSATDPDAPPTEDKIDDGQYLSVADGYLMMLSTGEADPFCMVRRETADVEIFSPTPADQANYNAPKNSTGSLSTGAKHAISMKLVKTDTGVMGAGMSTILTVDGVEVLNYIDDGTYLLSDPTPADPYGYLDTFDGIVLGNATTGVAGAAVFQLDNIRVATSVPEPSTFVLLVGALALWTRRRGH
jgi:hypothetical protein